MSGCLDDWVAVWLGGVAGKLDYWIAGGWLECWMDECMYGRVAGLLDGWIAGWLAGWLDGWMAA
jgi:hypothetical protein